MTDQSISSLEFQRFQDQLIALKEDKYKLEEKCEIVQRKLVDAENKLSIRERELLKANEFRNRLRNNKDIELMLNENDVLRERIATIESNFKLQNDVLKSECEKLISENRRLASQLETYSGNSLSEELSGKSDESTDNEDDKYKIRQLKMEITKIIEEKANIKLEVEKCREFCVESKRKELELVERINSLLNENQKCTVTINTLSSEKDNLISEKIFEIKELNDEFELQKEKLMFEKKCEISKVQEELKSNHFKEIESLRIDFTSQISKLNEVILSLTNDLKILKSEFYNEKNNLEEKIKVQTEEYETKIRIIMEDHEKEILQLNQIRSQLEDEVAYTKEEIHVVQKKNKKLLIDLKKQLEKEVKITQDTQNKLAEAVIAKGVASNQSIFSGCGFQSSVGGDDNSSVYSSNNGILSDSQNGSGSIPVTDDELKTLLDRVAESQFELGESKLGINLLRKENEKLQKTIEKQQKIILNYIQRRRGSNNDGSHQIHKSQSTTTTDALVLNGVLSKHSPDTTPIRSTRHYVDGEYSNLPLSSMLTKMKSSLKSLSSEVMANLNSSGTFNMDSRVTRSEVKQLQRVCEELMTRCLSLESDLQASIDFNIELQAQNCECKNSENVKLT